MPQELKENNHDPYFLHHHHHHNNIDDDRRKLLISSNSNSGGLGLRQRHYYYTSSTPGLEIPTNRWLHDRGENDDYDHGHHHNHSLVTTTTTTIPSASSNNHLNKYHTTTQIYYAKECACFEYSNHQDQHDNNNTNTNTTTTTTTTTTSTATTTLCPFTTSTCREIVNNHVMDGTPWTIDVSCQDEAPVSQFLFLFIWIIWGILLASLLLTHRGRSALSYLPAKICKCWNPTVVTFLEKYRKPFANKLIRYHILIQEEQMIRQQILRQERLEQAAQEARQQQQGNITTIEMATMTVQPPAPKLPTSLVLKTRLYSQDEELQAKAAARCGGGVDSSYRSESEGGGEGHTSSTSCCCTICFTPLKAGDRVGALSCRHIYHVECLKLWLQRRNSCPLCQIQNVAEPRYDEDDEEEAAAEEEADTAGAGAATDALSTTTTTAAEENSTTTTTTTTSTPIISSSSIMVVEDTA